MFFRHCQVLAAMSCEVPAKGIPGNPLVRNVTSCFVRVRLRVNISGLYFKQWLVTGIQPYHFDFEPMASATPSVVVDLEL